MENNKTKKGVMVGVIVAICLVTILGVTFAIWTYSNTLSNQELIAGDIYMKYTEPTKALSIENSMPKEYVSETDPYFEFTIDGRNTYSKDINYEIVLSYGDTPDVSTNRTERIRDDLLLFKLVEVKNNNEEEVIFDRMGYPSLEKTSIWVDTINANTINKITRKYRLYMWISPLTRIGNLDNSIYDMDTWNNKVYASIKVSVNGDFNEKTYMNCFTRTIATATYNEDRTDNEINACVEWAKLNLPIPLGKNPDEITYRVFCDGTGEFDGDGTIKNWLDRGRFSQAQIQKLVELGIFKDLQITKEKYSGKNLDYDNACQKDVVIPSVIDKVKVTILGEDYSIIKPVAIISGGVGFENKGIISLSIPSSVTIIGDSAFADNQLTSVNIPSSVTIIGDSAFANNKLTNVNIPNSVTTIGASAFANNKLTNVNIPNSVTTIGGSICIDLECNLRSGVGAFSYNQLTSVTIGNGIQYIGASVFEKNDYTNINLSSITIDKTCTEIKNIEASSEDTTKKYPWLDYFEPYTAPGVTIYGKNHEVCDSF